MLGIFIIMVLLYLLIIHLKFEEVNQVQGQVSSTEIKNLFWYLECSRRTYKMVVARGQRKKKNQL